VTAIAARKDYPTFYYTINSLVDRIASREKPAAEAPDQLQNYISF